MNKYVINPFTGEVAENAEGPTENVFCPTGEGGGVDPTCSPKGGSGQEYSRVSKTASDLHGKIPVVRGKEVKSKSHVGYHVTKRKNLESILKEGFSLRRVKAQWANDHAVSLASSAKQAADWFTGRKRKFDSDKYVILKVRMKGRVGNAEDVDPGYYSSARDFTGRVVRAGWDAGKVGTTTYIYNTKSIESISEVDLPEAD